MVHKILLLLVIALCAAPAATARNQEPEVNVRLATTLVRLGGTVQLQITVEGTKDAQLLLPLPEVEGLVFATPRGPRPREEFTRRRNGQVVHRVTVDWTVELRPGSEGEYEIPPLRLRVNGQEVSAPEAPLTLRVVADSEGAQTGLLEIEAPARVFEGQPFTVNTRFGFDKAQPIDRHDLYLPWWGSLRGVLELERTALDRGRDRIAINDRVEADIAPQAPYERSGAIMRTWELRRRYVASRPGSLTLESGTYQFGITVEKGFGFQPDRVRHFYAQSEPVEVEVVPVPEEGRPFDWAGAIGDIEVSRRVDRRDLDQGGTVRLTVVWTGDANLQFFEAPDLARLDAFAGFRVVGTTDEAFADERRVRYDLLAADPELDEIPAVPLWTFVPESERYELVETRPVPIRVRAVEGELIGYESTDQPEVVDLADLHTAPASGDGPGGISGRALVWTGLGLPALWWLLRTFVRRRIGDPDGPAASRRRAARRRLRKDLAQATSASAQVTALSHYLSARTGEADAAWIGRDVEEWAAVHPGLRPEAVAELVRLGDELDQRAWAARDEPLERARVLAVAEQLAKGGLA